MELKSVLEALLFSSEKPLSPAELREFLSQAVDHAEDEIPQTFRKTKVGVITSALEELADEVECAQRTFKLVCVAGAWQFVTRREYAPWLKALMGMRARPSRLSQAALETLAIIAYRQPLTRAEMEQIRGVSVDGVMQTLLERGLVESRGRAEVVGRPMNYGTTALFLEYFGLRHLEELPAADELQRIPVEKPPDLVTVEHGLATAPPGDLVPDGTGSDASAKSAAATPEVGDGPESPEHSPEACEDSTVPDAGAESPNADSSQILDESKP